MHLTVFCSFLPPLSLSFTLLQCLWPHRLRSLFTGGAKKCTSPDCQTLCDGASGPWKTNSQKEDLLVMKGKDKVAHQPDSAEKDNIAKQSSKAFFLFFSFPPSLPRQAQHFVSWGSGGYWLMRWIGSVKSGSCDMYASTQPQNPGRHGGNMAFLGLLDVWIYCFWGVGSNDPLCARSIQQANTHYLI